MVGVKRDKINGCSIPMVLSSDACSIVLTEAFQGQDLDLKSILSLAQFGVIGNLVEIQGSDGSCLSIYVE